MTEPNEDSTGQGKGPSNVLKMPARIVAAPSTAEEDVALAWFHIVMPDHLASEFEVAKLAEFRAQARAEEAMRWKAQDPHGPYCNPGNCPCAKQERDRVIEECAKVADKCNSPNTAAAIRALKENR